MTGFGGKPFAFSSVLPAVLLALVLATPGSSAFAQGKQGAVDAVTPVEEFSRRLDEFKKSIPDLNKKIEESAGSVDRWTDADKARQEIQELRAIVGAALGAVSDNGLVSQLGDKALAHARDKLKALELETRFKTDEKGFLVDQWRKLREETERATDELATARR